MNIAALAVLQRFCLRRMLITSDNKDMAPIRAAVFTAMLIIPPILSHAIPGTFLFLSTLLVADWNPCHT